MASAFAELRRHGVVVTRERGSTRVNARAPLGAVPPAVQIPAGARDLATGNPDPALLPDLGAVLPAAAADGGRLYGAPGDLPALVDLAAAQLHAATTGDPGRNGADAVVVSGALDGIERVLATAVPAGSKVAVEDPGYDGLLGLVRALGLTPVPVAVDQDGPIPEALRQAGSAGARAAIITNRAQNPTGAALSASRADALRGLLRDCPELLWIENDHLGDVAGTDLHTLAAATSRWVHIRSYNKALGPDLRVAVMLGSRDVVDAVRGRQALGPGWVSSLLQRSVLHLWHDPATAAILQTARDAYRHRRAILTDALADRGLSAFGRSGFNLWVPVADETTAVTALLSHGWVVAPGARYRQRAASGVRITISTLTDRDAAEIAGILADLHRPARRRNG